LIISIIATAVVGLLLGLLFPDGLTIAGDYQLGDWATYNGSVFTTFTNETGEFFTMPEFTNSPLGDAFSEFGSIFGIAFKGFGDLFSSWSALGIIFALLFVDFFDTAGTLMAVGNQAGLVNEDGEIEGSERALLVDSIGTMSGAILGTSNVTSYIESATGIEQGGRTGLTSITVAILFLLSVFAYPLLSLVNGVFDPVTTLFYSPVTAMALVMVGALMVGQLKEIDWSDKAIVIPAFLTIIFMLLAFSIAQGIAVGFIFYPIVMVAQGRAKEVNKMMYALGVLFLISFIINAI